MDGIPTAPLQPTRKKLNKLLVVGFVAIAVVILTFILFQLGWLPQRLTEQSKPDKNASVPQSQELSTEDAKKTLTGFIPPLIASSLAPSTSAEIFLTKQGSGQNDFIATWEVETGSLETKYSLSPDGNILSSIQITLKAGQNTTVSENTAKELTSEYFLPVPKGEFDCGTLNSGADYCESFWEETDGTKRGVGLSEDSVFYCQFGKDSKNYSWKSCAPEFSESGVQ